MPVLVQLRRICTENGTGSMQKRYVHRYHSDDSLPLTGHDTVSSGRISKARPTSSMRMRLKQSGQLQSVQIIICSVAIVFFVGVIILFASRTTPGSDETQTHFVRDERQLPLAEYVSLQYALAHSKLVGLYFAAAWCRVCTPVTKRIERILGAELLAPPSRGYHPPSDRASMSLIYVSSDNSENAFRSYQGTNWMAVPFQSSEMDAVKRHFSVCSKPEVDSLGIDQKFEIPTLLIIDAETHTIITTSGVDDLEEYQENAIDHWIDLQNLMRAMEDKYGEDDETGGFLKAPERRFHHHADSYSSLFA